MRASTISTIAWRTPGRSRPEPRPLIWRPSHGGTEEIIRKEKIWKGGEQARRVGDATPQTRNAEGRSGPTSQSEESEAGDRHRFVGGAEEGRESPAQANRPQRRWPKEGRPKINPLTLTGELFWRGATQDNHRSGRCWHSPHRLLGNRDCTKRISIQRILRAHHRVPALVRRECPC
jgi:hypothetical protein